MQLVFTIDASGYIGYVPKLEDNTKQVFINNETDIKKIFSENKFSGNVYFICDGIIQEIEQKISNLLKLKLKVKLISITTPVKCEIYNY